MPIAAYDKDFLKANSILAPTYNSIQNLVATAIAEERERCASVVERMGRSSGRVRKTHKLIAAEIRAARDRIGPR